ncbi:MAG: hypothetical protein WDM77_01020 [Steroidobacteraceae bacterium]
MHYASRELPAGMRLDSAPQSVPARAVTFLSDITGADAYDHGFSSHAIFDAMLRNIGAARSFLVLDCRLCSDPHGDAPDAIASLTPMASQLVDALLARKAAIPALQVLVIADPVNGLDGSASGPELARLNAAGIRVVTGGSVGAAGSQCLTGPPLTPDRQTGRAAPGHSTQASSHPTGGC